MNDVLFQFLSLSMSGSLIALILFALKPFVKKRFSQTWQYYIWIIVILRFLLPLTPQVSVVGELSRHVLEAADPHSITEINPDVNVGGETIIPPVPDVESTLPVPAQPVQNSEADSFIKPGYWSEIRSGIWLLWLGVALVLFVHKVASYRSFVRFIRIGSGIERISDPHILELYHAVLMTAKIKRPLPLYRNDQVASPMLVGIIHPALIIPTLGANDDEFRNILRHELTHYKRMDFLYKWLVQIALCLHWFNPLAYLVAKEINKCCELSCDEAVIKHLDKVGRRAYGDALMLSLTAQGNYSDFVVSMTMSENGNIVKERLDMIMNYKKKSALTSCAAAILTLLLLCGFTFTGAYAANANPAAPMTAVNVSVPYHETYTAKPNNAISARSRTGNWAMSDTASGNTVEEVLDNKLRFIEDVWQEKKETFVITEGISESSITDISSLQYMYNQSNIYRNLITVSDKLYLLPDSSFGRLSDKGQDTIYERYAFYLAEPEQLSLSASYRLDVGRMSVVIVSPEGTVSK